MTDGLLFLVPARGGSRRIPGKNMETVAGIPLVGHAVRLARRAARTAAGAPHVVACSTDDAAIAVAARAWGARVIDRPAELATDTASSVDVALQALDAVAPDAAGRRFRAVVLLQPTSPLTDVADVLRAIEAFDAAAGRPTISVTKTHPAAWHLVEDGVGVRLAGGDGGGGSAAIPTGAIYVIAPADLRRDRRFIAAGAQAVLVPPERSVDIDEPADLAVARALAADRPIRTVAIDDRVIGAAGGVFVIAEGGVNHDGSVDLAHRLVDAAADAGADAVKFQTFDPVALAAAGAPTADYQRRAVQAGTDQRAMLADLALPRAAWPGLRDHARDRGLVFLSTPFDDGSADLLDELGVPAFKVASGDLTNLPFLGRLARRGRPLLVSTGMADIVEVADAIDAIADAGDPPVALFHCVSSYPARPEDANLRAIATLRDAFGVPCGWSDHTPGIELPIVAVAMGASVVEKHLTLDRNGRGPDHAASLEAGEFGAMVAAIRTAAASLGTGDKRPVAAELGIAAVARKSLHWTRALPAGHRVEEGDVLAQRPGTGLRPGRFAEVLGHRTTRTVASGRPVDLDDVEPDR